MEAAFFSGILSLFNGDNSYYHPRTRWQAKGEESLEILLARADRAMLEVKRKGRNQTVAAQTPQDIGADAAI
ncbi:hypothetical protein [Robbsia sp. KACC 23696]|uniref:hypothetical protein n=1 Tax=Robbsia sp. KACC 23696 TaxID=3149231 RepID=UPI00325A5A72